MASPRDSYALPEGVRVYSHEELYERALRLLRILRAIDDQAKAERAAEAEQEQPS